MSNTTPATRETKMKEQEVFIKVPPEGESTDYCVTEFEGTKAKRLIRVKPITAIVLTEDELKKEKEDFAKGFAEFVGLEAWKHIFSDEWCRRESKQKFENRERATTSQLLDLYNEQLNKGK